MPYSLYSANRRLVSVGLSLKDHQRHQHFQINLRYFKSISEQYAT